MTPELHVPIRKCHIATSTLTWGSQTPLACYSDPTFLLPHPRFALWLQACSPASCCLRNSLAALTRASSPSPLSLSFLRSLCFLWLFSFLCFFLSLHTHSSSSEQTGMRVSACCAAC